MPKCYRCNHFVREENKYCEECKNVVYGQNRPQMPISLIQEKLRAIAKTLPTRKQRLRMDQKVQAYLY